MKMSGRGEFAEWAEVHGEFYGTSKKRIDDLRNTGYDVILDIDVHGAQQIKEHLREGTYIFVLPPSLEILKRRLENRMSESEIQIDKRLSRALAEIRTYTTYDYVIINDVLEDSLREFQAIIVSQQLKAEKIDPQWIEERFFRQEEK